MHAEIASLCPAPCPKSLKYSITQTVNSGIWQPYEATKDTDFILKASLFLSEKSSCLRKPFSLDSHSFIQVLSQQPYLAVLHPILTQH